MSEEKDTLNKEFKLLDELIENKAHLVKLANSSGYAEILKSFNDEKLSAIQDYLKDNSALNQAYSRLFNFLCNMLELFKDPTELENLLHKKEELMEQLDKVNNFEREQGFGEQRGGSL
jgi:hypothetical protein